MQASHGLKRNAAAHHKLPLETLKSPCRSGPCTNCVTSCRSGNQLCLRRYLLSFFSAECWWLISACWLQWVDPIQLHGIGQYASDAYFMFCRGLWQEVSPSDKDLLKYQQWLQSTNGEGTGLERDVMPSPASEGNATQPASGACDRQIDHLSS